MEKENFEACMQLNFLFQRFYVYMSWMIVYQILD